MKSKLLVAAGTALAVGTLTIAVPVFAHTDDIATAQNTTQTTEQNGRFGKFREKMQERMQNLTFEEQQERMAEHLSTAQERAQKRLDALYSGELETQLKNHLSDAGNYLQAVQGATTEEELQAVRDEMRAKMQELRDSGELPAKMGRGMHGFGGGPAPQAASEDAQ